MAAPLDPQRIRVLLLDIEGTTTPVEFVTERLFPYARDRVREFLHEHSADPSVRADLEALREQHAADAAERPDPPAWHESPPEARLASAIAYVHWLIERDSKATPLKSLQGKIWEAGYRTGELRGEVFSDVPRAFARWTKQKRDICIFSSGSVQAQKLLFAHSTAGDLTGFLRGYFDTSSGPKHDARSYRRIVEALAVAPNEVVFISDVVAELDAAREASLATALCVRSGEASPADVAYPFIRTFDEVFP